MKFVKQKKKKTFKRWQKATKLNLSLKKYIQRNNKLYSCVGVCIRVHCAIQAQKEITKLNFDLPLFL